MGRIFDHFMLASSRSLQSLPVKKQSPNDIFFCPEESNFYSYCLDALVLRNCVSSDSIIEFGSGDGSPVIKSLLRTDFNGTVYGFEINPLAYQVANSRVREYGLSDKYIIHNRCLFNSVAPYATYLISNPPYLPALDNKLYQPLLHGGTEGITLTKKLLSLNYENVLTLASSYSNPLGLVNYARSKKYRVSDFVISPMRFGYYSSEPKVMNRIEELRSSNRAFYSDNIYLLAGVLFTKCPTARDLSDEFSRLITSL